MRGTMVGRMITDGCGDEYGDKSPVETRTYVEEFTPILTFELTWN